MRGAGRRRLFIFKESASVGVRWGKCRHKRVSHVILTQSVSPHTSNHNHPLKTIKEPGIINFGLEKATLNSIFHYQMRKYE